MINGDGLEVMKCFMQVKKLKKCVLALVCFQFSIIETYDAFLYKMWKLNEETCHIFLIFK